MMAGPKKYLFVFLYVLGGTCTAQYMDTLRTAFSGRKTLDVGIDTRNSFVDHNRIGVQSVKLGVEFGKKISMGLGYAWLNNSTPILDNFKFYDGDLKKDTTISKRLTFNYLRFYVNYIYYKSRRWEFSIPIQAGVGKLGFKYNYKGETKKTDEGFCFLYEPEIDVKFKIFRWLGAEADVGYRFMFQKSSFIKNTFNSPLISLGVFIVWDEIALMAFPKNKWIQNKYGPSEW
jgi:hypothetical protein